MNTIKEHIRKQSFKNIYLLYGSENYLKKLYKNKLKNAIIADDDGMNCSYYEGKEIDESEVIRMADTMPFFAQRRLIIIENSGWFKSGGNFSDYIENMPETTFIIFVETETDKRNRLYKTVKSIGYAAELNDMDEKNLLLFALSFFKKENKNISDSDLKLFFECAGQNMDNISNEAEKLICYCIERDTITSEDILEVCTPVINGKIFVMIDAIAAKNIKTAIELYFDLLAVREKPMSVLYLLIRHFNILYLTKKLKNEDADNKQIASTASVPPFSVGKYIMQSSGFTLEELKNLLNAALQFEEQIKTGIMSEQIAVEMLIEKACMA